MADVFGATSDGADMASRNLENLYNSEHKSSNDKLRENYERTFGWSGEIDKLRDDIRREGEKGHVTGHFC